MGVSESWEGRPMSYRGALKHCAPTNRLRGEETKVGRFGPFDNWASRAVKHHPRIVVRIRCQFSRLRASRSIFGRDRLWRAASSRTSSSTAARTAWKSARVRAVPAAAEAGVEADPRVGIKIFGLRGQIAGDRIFDARTPLSIRCAGRYWKNWRRQARSDYAHRHRQNRR